MITTNLDLTYTMIWSLALANILGTGICLALTPVLAQVSRARIQILAPLVIMVVFLATFQASVQFGDLVSLMFFSVLGWFMKRFAWSRPPVVLGLVLSKIIENYLFISVGAYGITWLGRPLVLVIMALAVISLIFGIRQTRRTPQAPQEGVA